MSKTSFTIGQSSKKRIGEAYFDWAIWIEEDKTTLQTIKKVTYYLHNTFPDPVKVKWNATAKFKLKTAGWGTFMIHIHLLLKNGQEVEQSHYLVLDEDYDSTKITRDLLSTRTKKKKAKKVFISSSSMDRDIVQKIKKILEQDGVEVVRAEDTPDGDSYSDFIQNAIKNASSIIEVKSEYESAWQTQEIDLAKNEKIPVKVINAEAKKLLKEAGNDELGKYLDKFEL